MLRRAMVLVFLGLASCTHMAPKPIAGCAYTAYSLRIDSNAGARTTAQDFEGVLRAAMSAPAAPGPGLAGPQRPSVLILSGGSQNGAFGAARAAPSGTPSTI